MPEKNSPWAKRLCKMKHSRRRSLSAGDLTDAELALIARAEIPRAECYSLKGRSTRKRRSGP